MRRPAHPIGAVLTLLLFVPGGSGCLRLPPPADIPDTETIDGAVPDTSGDIDSAAPGDVDLSTIDAAADAAPDAAIQPDAAPDADPDAAIQPDADPDAAIQPDADPDAAPPLELCNGVDDDGDGAVDEAPQCCEAGAFRPCGLDEGVCFVAEQGCVDGQWAPCPGLVEAGPERCDGRDDDCDGATDEGLADGEACYTGPDGTRGVGRCIAGQGACIDGVGGCAGEVVPRPSDPCDYGDEDCDGEVDEDCVRCDPDIVAPAGYVCIPPGTFTMGLDRADVPGTFDPTPAHPVQITYPLLVRTDEMNKREYADLLGLDGFTQISCGGGADCPVRMDWAEAIIASNRLSALDGLECCFEIVRCGEVDPMPCGAAEPDDLDGCAQVRMPRRLACEGHRPPSEAEWEYAAGAGTLTRYWSGETIESVGDGQRFVDPAWTRIYSRQYLRGIDEGPPNHWGLRNVLGNVAEHVLDHAAPYVPDPDGAPLIDPLVWSDGLDVDPIVRGGNWREHPDLFSTRVRKVPNPNADGVRRRRDLTRTGLRLVRRAPAR